MIGDNDKGGFVAGRLLKALPNPAPGHPAWGKELAPKLLHFHLPKMRFDALSTCPASSDECISAERFGQTSIGPDVKPRAPTA